MALEMVLAGVIQETGKMNLPTLLLPLQEVETVLFLTEQEVLIVQLMLM
jgi:hypothetical protein